MHTGSAVRASPSFLIRLLLIPVLLVATAAQAAAAPAFGGAPTASDQAAESRQVAHGRPGSPGNSYSSSSRRRISVVSTNAVSGSSSSVQVESRSTDSESGSYQAESA